ncbi:hypothetical protein V2S66_00055 [Streptomyces sp. V4-01]|uniref:Serine hydrolase n=1 Tax=Actinacidiphila polyblastidii TaxID=3110430 RepID=A0ABU7P3W8_9ACTN|nr:hypothetical protein [Streptomyces sp. V4-01]
MKQQPIERALRELAELAGPHQIDLNALGGRIRRRHRTRLAVVSATAVALVAACGWLLPDLASGDGAAGPAGPVRPAQQGPQGSLTTPAPGRLDVEARQVAELFERVLPPGRVTVVSGQGLHDKGLPSPLGSGRFEPSAAVVYDDGHGAVLVRVVMSRWGDPDKTTSPFTCAVGRDEPKPDQCETVLLPGGGVFQLSRMDALKGAWNAEWTATYAAPDGARVVIQEDNAPNGKGSAPTRGEPPFDAAQLRQMVTSPLWRQQLAAIPAAGGQSRQTTTPFGPDGVGAIFYRLMPSGFTRSGFADAQDPLLGNTMVLADAQGRGSVFSGVLTGGATSEAGYVTGFRQDYPNATLLPNGDWLGTKKVTGKGGTGTGQYWVAVLRGHSRIVVVALNSVGVDGPRTRPTPVLTIDQLTAIAGSPAWGTGR